ncbi:MAG: phosphodiester glycosidase family protein [Actinomycetota bacterium]
MRRILVAAMAMAVLASLFTPTQAAAQTPESRPLCYSTASCLKARPMARIEIAPGISVRSDGSTVTVVARRSLVRLDAVDGAPTVAGRIDGDVVVNANWFTPAGPLAPVVASGRRSGSGDTTERGQIVMWADDCFAAPPRRLTHVWMGRLYEPGRCAHTVVSGVSLIHKGVRSDAYPGIDITTGYTNVNRSHSFIGFNDTEIVIVATRVMNVSTLADYVLSLGVTEGVLLDGGGSTQIAAGPHRIVSQRRAPSFAVLTSLASEPAAGDDAGVLVQATLGVRPERAKPLAGGGGGRLVG